MDIVLLLPVDPVGPWALSVHKHKCGSQFEVLRAYKETHMDSFGFFRPSSLCLSCSLSEFYAGRLFT